MAALLKSLLLLGGAAFLSSAQKCNKTDGTGACCYSIAVGFPGAQARFGAPDYHDSPLHGVPQVQQMNGSTSQPIAYGYALDKTIYQPQNDHGKSNWGWGVQQNGDPVFGFMETQQFVFPFDASSSNELLLTVAGQGCGSTNYADGSPAFRALWQGGSATVKADTWPSKTNTLKVDYGKYIAADKNRKKGDPMYISIVPCTDDQCTQPDSYRAIIAMISFRPQNQDPKDPLAACKGDFDGNTGAGYDCCYVNKSIGLDSNQSEIDEAVSVHQFAAHQSTSTRAQGSSCIRKPSWFCYDKNWKKVGSPGAGNAKYIQYKGSLVDFILSGRSAGRGVRIVLGDLVSLQMPLSTTYVEYQVDPSDPSSCNTVCKTGEPSDADVVAHGSTCKVSSVSSFAAVNGGMVSVGGYGRVDGLKILQDPTYFRYAPYPQWTDSTPGNDCPSCNRFCAWSPYAQGMHVLTTCCNQPSNAQCSSSNLLQESGDARYHIHSGLMELSSNFNSGTDTFAVDVSDVTLANPLKRGDSSFMIQSPGHFVRGDNCAMGTLEEQRSSTPCSGPNQAARSFGLKYVGAWHDAADGPSIKSEYSQYLYTFVHNTDDCLKPYSNSIVRDSTVIHGGVGGVVTPCTYNLLGYTPGCSGTQTLNTHVIRNLDPLAGYDGRGGIIATRYCAGKNTHLWTHMLPEGRVAGNVIDGLYVERLGNLNQNGRAVGITVDAPTNQAPVYFCSSMYEPIFMKFEPGAFVINNWDVDVVEDGRLAGPALWVSAKTGWISGQPLTTFASNSSFDVTGLELGIPADGLGCGYDGSYLPCLYSSKDSRALGCEVHLQGNNRMPYSKLPHNGPCHGFHMMQTVACESLSSADSDCLNQVVFPYDTPEKKVIFM